MVSQHLIEEVDVQLDGLMLRRERPATVHACWACGKVIHWEEARLEQLLKESSALDSTVVLCAACRDWKPSLADMTQARLWRDLLRRFGRQAVATDG